MLIALPFIKEFWSACWAEFSNALVVFWSRLYLRRHDLRETLVGAFLGLLGGLVTAW
jgi:hypothetical protein